MPMLEPHERPEEPRFNNPYDHHDDLTPLSDRDELRQEVRRLKAELEKKSVVNQLVIRDPDYENDYTTDANINVIEIDIGGMWTDYKYFASDLADPEARDHYMAVDFEESVMEEVKHLPEDNIVRQAAEEFFENARQHGKR